MRGQVWQEYILLFAAVLLLAVGALAYLFKPSMNTIICTTAYMRAQSEIIRQEFNSLIDYSIYGFKCRLGDQPEVNILCKCAEPTLVGGATWAELHKFGIDADVDVVNVG